jgi:hypothetical protein
MVAPARRSGSKVSVTISISQTHVLFALKVHLHSVQKPLATGAKPRKNNKSKAAFPEMADRVDRVPVGIRIEIGNLGRKAGMCEFFPTATTSVDRLPCKFPRADALAIT